MILRVAKDDNKAHSWQRDPGEEGKEGDNGYNGELHDVDFLVVELEGISTISNVGIRIHDQSSKSQLSIKPIPNHQPISTIKLAKSHAYHDSEFRRETSFAPFKSAIPTIQVEFGDLYTGNDGSKFENTKVKIVQHRVCTLP